MSNVKDLVKAVACISTAYQEDLKEFEDMKRRVRRAERKIRDLSVELQHYAELAHTFESRMEMDSPIIRAKGEKIMQNSALTPSWIVRIIRKLTLSPYRRYSTRELERQACQKEQMF